MKRLKFFAWATLISTLFLIALGNVVTTTGSGMGCGDHWPGCNGKLIPDFTHYTVMIEFAHRAVAGPIVSLLALVTTILAWRIKEPAYRSLLRLTSSLMMGLLALQVVLGAITVKLVLPPHVVIMHLGVAMAFLAALTYLALLAGQDLASRDGAGTAGLHRHRLFPFYILTTALTYLQILLGAYVRHSGSALACPDFPLCQGQLLPAWGQPMIHFSHRLGAYIVAVLVIWGSFRVAKAPQPALRSLGRLTLALVLAQITLGILSVLSVLAVAWTTLHILTGALLLLSLVALSARLARPGHDKPGRAEPDAPNPFARTEGAIYP